MRYPKYRSYLSGNSLQIILGMVQVMDASAIPSNVLAKAETAKKAHALLVNAAKPKISVDIVISEAPKTTTFLRPIYCMLLPIIGAQIKNAIG